MHRKRFYVRVDLELHAITCPGVWLCTHGYVEATIKALGYFFRTGAMEPRFPLLCHDHFTMEGYFKSVGSLQELEQVLAGEKLEITLWQNGRRLAYFLGTLTDVMKPTLPRLSCEHQTKVDLLMKATPAFPGILAPKLELSAEIAVQDRLAKRNASVDSYCSRHCTLDKLNPMRLVYDAKQAPRINRHCGELGCDCYVEERRRQQPVSHVKRAQNCVTCHNCKRPESSASFEADLLSHNNAQRRLSTCSSLLSNNSNTLSQSSFGTTSCMRSISGGGGGYCSPSNLHTDAQQRCCDLCQEYQRVFSN